jgi:hypothetical protein
VLPVTIKIPVYNQSTLRTVTINFVKDGKVIIGDIFSGVDKDSTTYQHTYDLFEFCVPGDTVQVDIRISDRRDGSYYISHEYFVVQ